MQAIESLQRNVDEVANLLKVLSNPHRLFTVSLLLEGELSVGQINQQLPLSQSALSQHLAVLRKSGIVSTRKQAQVVYYRIARAEVKEVLLTIGLVLM